MTRVRIHREFWKPFKTLGKISPLLERAVAGILSALTEYPYVAEALVILKAMVVGAFADAVFAPAIKAKISDKLWGLLVSVNKKQMLQILEILDGPQQQAFVDIVRLFAEEWELHDKKEEAAEETGIGT